MFNAPNKVLAVAILLFLEGVGGGILSRSRCNFDVGGGLLGPWSNSTFTLALGELCFVAFDIHHQ